MKILRISICLIVCLVFIFGGCQKEQEDSIGDTSQNDHKDSIGDTSQNDHEDSVGDTSQNDHEDSVGDTSQNDHEEPPMYDLYVEVHSAEELAKMREMASCSDEKLLKEYLQTSGSGAMTKEELEQFIKLIDTIPYVSLIEGELTWACHKIGESIDTGKPYNILSISTIADNGEWVRIEYHLDSLDSKDKIANELKETDASAVLAKPVQSKDKKVTVYTEIRRVQTAGKSIWWAVDIDGIFARIIFSTENMDAVETESVFSNCTVTNFDTQ